MARRQIIELIDDLDGTPLEDGVTVSFALDGAEYEIDLSAKNAEALREAFAPYVKVGRKLGRSGSAPVPPRRRKSSNDLNAIREWARANGHTVSDRGRVAASVIEAYKATNS